MHFAGPARFFVQAKENDVKELQKKITMVYANPNAVKPLVNPQRGNFKFLEIFADELLILF